MEPTIERAVASKAQRHVGTLGLDLRQPSRRTATLLSGPAYERARARYVAAMRSHRALRRLRVAPNLTLLFESWDTVLFQVHEILRIEQIRSPRRARQELETYTRLAPRSGSIAATALVDGGSRVEAHRMADALGRRGTVFLKTRRAHLPAICIDEQPDVPDPVRYLRFELPATVVADVLSRSTPLFVGVTIGDLTHCVPLTREQTQPIVEDADDRTRPAPLLYQLAGDISRTEEVIPCTPS